MRWEFFGVKYYLRRLTGPSARRLAPGGTGGLSGSAEPVEAERRAGLATGPCAPSSPGSEPADARAIIGELGWPNGVPTERIVASVFDRAMRAGMFESELIPGYTFDRAELPGRARRQDRLRAALNALCRFAADRRGQGRPAEVRVVRIPASREGRREWRQGFRRSRDTALRIEARRHRVVVKQGAGDSGAEKLPANLRPCPARHP